MRALLIYYLTRHFLYSDNDAYLIYGTYTALVYLTPVIGGILADRYLGSRKVVVLGGLMLVAGHFGMAFEGDDAVAAAQGDTHRDPVLLAAFYLSLSLIAVGAGFLKTNISALVGKLYAPDDPRRDSGFTYAYMGANIGSALAPLPCGWLGETYGWRYGFGLAGVGMLVGLVVFLRGQKYLGGHGEPPEPVRLRHRPAAGLTLETWLYLGAIPIVIAAWSALMHPQVVGMALALIGLLSAAYVLWFAFRRCGPTERDHLLVCGVLILFTIGFWAFYEQTGSSLALFAGRVVDRSIGAGEIPASTLQALPPLFVIAGAPLFGLLWTALSRRGRDPSTPVKFVFGLSALALAFFVLAAGAWLVPSGQKVPLIWLILNFLLLVVGEMCLGPVGMAMVTRLSPPRIVGLMMGLFYLAYAASSYLAGQLAQLTSLATVGGAAASLNQVTQHYAQVYSLFGLAAAMVALILLALSPHLTRQISDRQWRL